MSEALSQQPLEQGAGTQENDAQIYDLAKTQEVNGLMDQYDAYEPKSPEDAHNTANRITAVSDSLQAESQQVGHRALERVQTAAAKGVNSWVLDKKQLEATQKVAQGERPSNIPYKEWLGLTKAEKEVVSGRAAKSIELSDGIVRYGQRQEADAKRNRAAEHANKAAEYRQKREALLADKLEAEKKRVSGEAYHVKRAELETIRDERLTTELAKHANLKPGARHILETNLRERFDRDVEDSASAAGEEAASTREQFINENGGPAAIGHIRRQEEESAAKEKFLRHLHGDNEYEKRFGSQNNVVPASPEPAKGPERPDTIPYKEWMALLPSEREARVALEAARTTANQTGNTVTPTRPETFKQIQKRIKGAFGRAKGALKGLYEKAGLKVGMGMNNVIEYLTDEEKEHRRNILAGAAGVAAVALAYSATKGFNWHEMLGMKSGGSGHAAANSDTINQALGGRGGSSAGANTVPFNQSPVIGGGRPEVPSLPTGNGGVATGGNAVAAVPPTPTAPKTITVGRGVNPWEISRHQLEQQGLHDPSSAQIMAYDKKLGKANGYQTWNSWVKAARDLKIGTKLKLPKLR